MSDDQRNDGGLSFTLTLLLAVVVLVVAAVGVWLMLPVHPSR
jgi:hypothetical protein